MARLWLLDFDGTLVDSEKTIKACYLKVGHELVPERCSFIATMVIGPTLDKSSKMILTDKNLHLLDEFKNRFQHLYDEKLVFDTPQYPNVDETLKDLRSLGDHLCIVTNKRANPTRKLIHHYGWHLMFEWVACMDEYPVAKSKADLIRLKKNLTQQYDSIYLVGDTINDGLAALENNINFIQASYGYGKDEDWSKIKHFKKISDFSELINITS